MLKSLKEGNKGLETTLTFCIVGEHVYLLELMGRLSSARNDEIELEHQAAAASECDQPDNQRTA